MRNIKLSLFVIVSLFIVIAYWPEHNAQARQTKVDFVRDIQPLLNDNCVRCHGATKQMAQLRLDNKQSAARVLGAGNARASRLFKRISVDDSQHGEPQMPKGVSPLKAEQIALIEKWINEGAVWPDTASARGDGKHWAFIPPVRAALPTVKNKAWAKNPIDAFVLARLEQEGLTPAPAADRVTLLRR